jgi:hypothetical protein
MKGTRTVFFDVIQSTDVPIIGINVGVGGKFCGLMDSCMPLVDGRIELGFQVSVMSILMCHTHRYGHQCKHRCRNLAR